MNTNPKQRSFEKSFGYVIFDDETAQKANLSNQKFNIIFSPNSSRKKEKNKSIIIIKEDQINVKQEQSQVVKRRINFDKCYMNIAVKVEDQQNQDTEDCEVLYSVKHEEQCSRIEQDDQFSASPKRDLSDQFKNREYLIIDDDDNLRDSIITYRIEPPTTILEDSEEESNYEKMREQDSIQISQTSHSSNKRSRILKEKKTVENKFHLIYRMVSTRLKNVYKLVACKVSKRNQKLCKNDIKFQDQFDENENEIVIQYQMPSEIDYLEPINEFHCQLRDKVLGQFFQ